jgi:hypothetical protein
MLFNTYDSYFITVKDYKNKTIVIESKLRFRKSFIYLYQNLNLNINIFYIFNS